MRVLMLAAIPYFTERGMAFAIADRLRAIGQLGHQVDLLTLGGGVDPWPAPGGVRIIRLGGAGRLGIGPSWSKFRANARLALAAALRLRHVRYDLIHANGETAWWAWPLSRQRRIPLLYDMHFDTVEELAARPAWHNAAAMALAGRVDRFTIRRADVVVAISDRLADLATRLRPRRPTFVIENRPAEIMFQVPPYQPTAEPLVLYTGNFSPMQGIVLLVESARLVMQQQPWVRFELIGGTAGEAAEARRQAQRAGLGNRIAFLGNMGIGEVAEHIARASILVSPRLAGDVPLKVYHYLAAGRPILATRTPAHSILDETVARLADPRPDSLAEAMLDLLAHPEQATALASRARTYAREHLTWSRYIGQIAEALAAVGGK